MPQLRWYFHTSQSTCAIAAPSNANCNSLSETVPDLTDTAASAIAGGHLSHATASVQTNKPRTRTDTSEGTTTPTTTTPVPTAQQFGWFTDTAYDGTFATGTWTFVARWDDNRNNITGGPLLLMYAGTTRDFANLRFIRTFDGSATDWWTGAAAAGTAATINFASVPSIAVGTAGGQSGAEYFLFRTCCKETTAGSGFTHTEHQEGSNLTDTARANILTATFTASGAADPFPAGFVPPFRQFVRRR